MRTKDAVERERQRELHHAGAHDTWKVEACPLCQFEEEMRWVEWSWEIRHSTGRWVRDNRG